MRILKRKQSNNDIFKDGARKGNLMEEREDRVYCFTYKR